jgi:ribonucleotide reductase alpha subunit
VKYASKRAGIGLEASAIRAEGSRVGNGEIRHTGVVPFYRMFESALKSCSQGGIRGASLSLYTAIWHLEIQDILVLKNNKGTQDNRVRKLDYGIQINNYFYNKLIKGENISLFSPSEQETPGLREAFFADQNKFIELYEKYEKDSSIRRVSISASELFTKLMIERKDTGRIYIFNVDNVNNYVPFNEPIKTSNLCLTGDTRISTDRGLLTLKSLYEEQTEFNVSSDDRAFEGSEFLYEKSRHVIDDSKFGITKCRSSKVFLTSKMAEVFELKTKAGYKLKCTSDHGVMTSKGFLPLDTLKKDDEIYIQSGTGLFSENQIIPEYQVLTNKNLTNRKTYVPLNIPKTWSIELGEMLGWLIGDGFIHKSNKSKAATFIISKTDECENTDKIIKFVEEIYGRPLQLQIINDVKHYKVTSTNFVTWLETLGVTFNKAHGKKIPHSIWSAPKDAQIGFLRGLFGADGTVDISNNCQAITVSLSSCSRQLLEEVQLLLSNFGIKSAVYVGKPAGFSMLPDSNRELKLYATRQMFCLKIGRTNRNKFINDIGFILPRKNKLVEDWIEKSTGIRKGTYREKFVDYVESITYKGIEEVFDITVDTSHSFIANGIVVHNCAEILLPTHPLQSVDDTNGRVALCTLSAINLGNIRNLDDLEKIMWNAVSKLDNLLEYQDYMLPAAREATLDYRPLGIGIINLAYYLAKNGFKFSDNGALQLLHDTFEAISFYGIKASMELAKIKGPCREYSKTKYALGILPIDRYNKNVDKLINPAYKLDWEWLRAEISKYGIRNATILANLPAESSSKIMNATNGQEAVRSLITIKGNKSNISKQVVPEVNRLKNRYDLLWDMKNMDGVIHTAAVMQKFVCQSLSTNLSYNPANYENGEIPMSILLGDLLKCNYYGIRTLYYHNTNDQKDVDMVETSVKVEIEETKEEVCDSCTI